METSNIKHRFALAEDVVSPSERIYNPPFALLLTLLLCIVLAGCASDKDAYRYAEQQDTLKSWSEFISQHPNSQYGQDAKARLSALERQKQEEERKKQEDLRIAWDSAVQKNTLPAYWDVWEMTNGKGNFAKNAQASIHKLIAQTIGPLIGDDVNALREETDFPIWFFTALDICRAVPPEHLTRCAYTYAAPATVQPGGGVTLDRITKLHGLLNASLVVWGIPSMTSITNATERDIWVTLYPLPSGGKVHIAIDYKAPTGSIDTGNGTTSGMGFNGKLVLGNDGSATLTGGNITLTLNLATAPYKLIGDYFAVVHNKGATSVFDFGKARNLFAHSGTAVVPPTVSSPVTLKPGNETRSVQDNWGRHCAKRHGVAGDGGTLMGQRLKVRDLRNAGLQAQMNESNMIERIRTGASDPQLRMKGFGDVLSQGEIKDLVWYIRGFRT